MTGTETAAGDPLTDDEVGELRHNGGLRLLPGVRQKIDGIPGLSSRRVKRLKDVVKPFRVAHLWRWRQDLRRRSAHGGGPVRLLALLLEAVRALLGLLQRRLRRLLICACSIFAHQEFRVGVGIQREREGLVGELGGTLTSVIRASGLVDVNGRHDLGWREMPRLRRLL